MSKLIEFDEKSYKSELSTLTQTINGINKAISLLYRFEEVTLDKLLKIATKEDYIKTERYHEKLKEFCIQFSVQYETLNFKEHEHIIKMGQSSVQYLFDAKKLIGFVEYDKDWIFTDEYITLFEGVVSIAPEAEEKLRVKHTYYTTNKKEVELLDKVTTITNLLNEIDKEFGNQKGNSLFFFDFAKEAYIVNRLTLVHMANISK